MSLQTKKLKLIQILINTESHTILDKVKSILMSDDEKDIWQELSNVQQAEINQALIEMSNEEVMDYDTFMEKNT